MKKRFSEQQIIKSMKEAETGIPVKELSGKHRFGDASFYTGRARLNKLLAKAILKMEALKVVVKGKPRAR